MASIQETFELSSPADRRQRISDVDGNQGFERYWDVDVAIYPDIVRFLLDQQPPPCEAKGIGSDDERYGAVLFELDKSSSPGDFGRMAVKAAEELPIDAIMVINFEDPPVTVSMRMPQAPYNPEADPAANTTSIGHLGVIHTVDREPSWLEPEDMTTIPHKH